VFFVFFVFFVATVFSFFCGATLWNEVSGFPAFSAASAPSAVPMPFFP
jgi:hypothetical protein